MNRSKRFDGPVIVVQSDTDPGDIGEPREFWSDEDKATVLVVPSVECWRDLDDEVIALRTGERSL